MLVTLNAQPLILPQNGKAVFSKTVPTTEPKLIGFNPDTPEEGGQQILYASHTKEVDLSKESDIDQYADARVNGMPPGLIAPPQGFSSSIITMGPGAESPLHRTMTLDVVVILEGVVELHLDSGESKTLRAGDSTIQRGTLHKWINVTPGGGKLRMLGTVISVQGPIEIGGQKLDAEWRF